MAMQVGIPFRARMYGGHSRLSQPINLLLPVAGDSGRVTANGGDVALKKTCHTKLVIGS